MTPYVDAHNKGVSIAKMIDHLRGSANGMDTACEDFELDPSDAAVTEAVDAEIFSCCDCNWWCPIEEESSELVGHDEWICYDCARDNHELEPE